MYSGIQSQDAAVLSGASRCFSGEASPGKGMGVRGPSNTVPRYTVYEAVKDFARAPKREFIMESDLLESSRVSVKRDVNLFRILRAQTLTVSFKSPWNFLAETNLAASLAASFSEQTSLWWRRGESNPCAHFCPSDRHLHEVFRHPRTPP